MITQSRSLFVQILFAIVLVVTAYVFYEYNTQCCFLKYRYFKYCNIDNFPKGEEGKKSPLVDERLNMVYTILRHGDRSPINNNNMNILKNITAEIKCDETSFIKVNKTYEMYGKILKVLLGDDRIRSADGELPSAANRDSFKYVFQDNCSSSYMTPRGLVQLFLLGEFFDENYKNQLNNNSYKVIIRSTNTDRTKQSALAFLSGLLNSTIYGNNNNITLDVVFTYSNELTGLLINDVKSGIPINCSKILNKWNTFELSSSNSPILYDKYNKLLNKLSNIKQLSMEYTDRLKYFVKLVDVLYVLDCHHRNTYKKIINQYIPNELQNELIRFTDKVLVEKHNYMNPNITTLPIMLNFFKHADMHVRIDVDRKNFLPIYLDSAHDTTLLPIILLLDLPEKYNYWPIYASRIVFEIWTRNVTNYVRILYDGNEITCESSYCKDSCEKYAICLYSVFRNNYFNGKSSDHLWSNFIHNQC